MVDDAWRGYNRFAEFGQAVIILIREGCGGRRSKARDDDGSAGGKTRDGEGRYSARSDDEKARLNSE